MPGARRSGMRPGSTGSSAATEMLPRLALLLSILAGPAMPGDPDLGALITERLALMDEVTAWTQARDVAVEDLAREAVVIEKAEAQAAEAGIDPQGIRPFFAAQIDAAKSIQSCWIARWQAVLAVPPANPPDLRAEIRPELIRLGAAITDRIAANLGAGAPASTDEALGRGLDCFDAGARDAILVALGHVRPAGAETGGRS